MNQKKVLIINGPNLNMLGKREPEIYGSETLEDIQKKTDKVAKTLAYQCNWEQYNNESELIESLHSFVEKNEYDALIINPAAFSHTSVAIVDALKMIKKPKIEVHLSNTNHREDYRQQKLTAKACDIIMEGLGPDVYSAALYGLKLVLGD